MDARKSAGDDRAMRGSSPAIPDPFTLISRGSKTALPVVLAAPHGGRAYSPALLAAMRHPDQACLRLEDRHVDTLVGAIAKETGATMLVASAPRAMIDLNRAEDDVDWSMVSGAETRGPGHSLANRRARMGLGLIPRRLHGLGEIWRAPLPHAELEERLETVHRPYHRVLAKALQETCDVWGVAVLLDIHSMPPLQRGRGQPRAPEFVLGDRFGCSCDSRLSARALKYFAGSRRLAAHNRPYSGGYVLDRHGHPARGIHAMQIEVCRSLYLDKRFEEPSARFAAVSRVLVGLVRAIADEAMGLRRIPASFSEAAE